MKMIVPTNYSPLNGVDLPLTLYVPCRFHDCKLNILWNSSHDFHKSVIMAEFRDTTMLIRHRLIRLLAQDLEEAR